MRSSPTPVPLHRRPSVVGVACLLTTLLLWFSLVANERRHVRDVTRSKCDALVLQIQQGITSYVHQLERIANRWALRDGPFPEREWSGDIRLLETTQPGYQAVEYADPSYTIQRIVPLEGNERALGFNLASEPRRREATERARLMGRTHMTRSIRLVQGGLGFLIYSPISRQGEFLGMIVGVFRYQPLLNTLLASSIEGFGLTIKDGEQQIYSFGPPAVGEAPEATGKVMVEGVEWTLHVWPERDLIGAITSPLPNVALLVGLVLTGLLTWSVHLSHGLVQSEARLRSTYEAVPVSIWQQDLGELKREMDDMRLRGIRDLSAWLLDNPPFVERAASMVRVHDVNQATVEMFGALDKQQVIEALPRLLGTASARVVFAASLAALARGEESFSSEVTYRTLQGDDLYALVNITFPKPEDERQVALVSVLEITDRHRAEVALQRSEERERSAATTLKAVLEAVPVAVFFSDDADRTRVRANRLGYHMLGAPHGSSLGGLKPSEGHTVAYRFMRNGVELPREELFTERSMADGVEVRDEEMEIVFASGLRRTLLCNAAPLFKADGEVFGVVGTAMDVTAQRRAEAAILQANDALAKRATMLETAYRELEAFSYTVSHDLRAPLRSIDGFCAILFKDFAAQLPPPAQRYLGLVRRNTQNMGRLIDDLLYFSRLGRKEVRRQSVDMKEVVARTVDLLYPDGLPSRVRLDVGDLPPCNGDPDLLVQVWKNLIENAVKYSRDADAPHVEVGYGNEAWFVRDNGVGLDMQYADKLFGVFQRLHSGDQFEGTGVGLAIVRLVVERHGGRAWLESAPGRGTTVYFTIGAPPAS